MNYVEMFSGLGGMGYGLMRAGMKCVGFAEWDKFAHKAFRILHDHDGRMWRRSNVRYVSNRSLRKLRRKRGPIQVLAAGFPCQTFSIAGKRRGFKDRTRGTLFFEILRWASILEPECILLENVEGLLNHDGGRTFAIILCALAELGYDAEWCVLNSAAWVPQNRERVFIVASLRGRSGRKVFPFGGQNPNAIKILGMMGEGYRQVNEVLIPDGICTALRTFQGGNLEPKVLVVGNTNPSGNGMNGQVFDSRGLAPTLTTNKGEGNRILVTGKVDGDSGQTGNVYSINGMAPTQLRQHGNAVTKIMDRYRVRKLTPLECFRLQSFPDEWYYKLKEHGISDSQLYKMAGNAVTSVVAYEIGKRIMSA